MKKYKYKDIELKIVERLITIGGKHRIILQSAKGVKVILTSNKSIKANTVVNSIEQNYERVKQLIL